MACPGRTLRALARGSFIALQSIATRRGRSALDELPIGAPFQRTVRPGPVSTCGVCHAYEEPAEGAPAPMAFTSEALRFRDEEIVEPEEMLAEWAACDPDPEPERCARLDALFAHGEVVHQPFDPSLPTIYQ